jgi:hypothetical protein
MLTSDLLCARFARFYLIRLQHSYRRYASADIVVDSGIGGTYAARVYGRI